MIRYYLRMLPVLLKGAMQADGQRVSRITQRVRLSEIDLNRHMNQSVYAAVLEMGRADWAVRSGGFLDWRAAGLNPVVAEQHIVYRRELKPLQRYLIDTRATAVDGRLLRFEQHILVGDRVHVAAEARLIFVGEQGVVSAEDITPRLQPFLTEPLPVHDWRVAH